MSKVNMFYENYNFRGSYVEKVYALTQKIDSESNADLFNSNVELFIFASLVGVLSSRKGQQEKSPITTKILAEQFIKHSNNLRLAFKFVILASEIDYPDPVTRLNKAFRNPETEENYELFEQYMLGGINELYEKLILSTNVRFEDYLTSVNKLISSLKVEEDVEDFDDDLSTEDFFID